MDSHSGPSHQRNSSSSMEKVLDSEMVSCGMIKWDSINLTSNFHLHRVKQGIPGEKYLGKDQEGWEYTSHDLWKKKLVWKEAWKKIWVPSTKQIWVPSKKLTWIEDYKKIYKTEKQLYYVEDKKLAWKEAWKQIWKTDKVQIWVPDKKLTWVEGWKQIWKPSKKLEFVHDKKLAWKEAWKQIWVPDYKQIWVPAYKKIWKPVITQEWFPTPDHHGDLPHDDHGQVVGWKRSDASQSKVLWKRESDTSSIAEPASTSAPVVNSELPSKQIKETSSN